MASRTPPSPTKPQSSALDQEAAKKEQDLSFPRVIELEPESNLASEPAVANPPATQEDQWVSGFKLLNIIAAITLVWLLVLVDTSIIVTAVPHITSDFHSLPDIGCAAFQPLTGKLFMNLDSKWTFMGFFTVFEIGSLICGVAISSKMLILGRAIAGIGSSGILNGVFTIIAGCVPLLKRPALIGFVMGVSDLGLVMGPLIGGVLTQYTTWRWCFYINLPFGGLVAAMLAFIHIPDQISKPKLISFIRTIPSKLDLIGFALFTPATIQFLLAIQYGGIQLPWNSAQIIGLFCGAGGTLITFLAWEYYKGDEAMIPLSMLRERNIWASCLAYGLLMGQIICTSFYLPIYFQGIKGASPTLSGVYLLPSILGQLFSSITSGMLVGRVGYYLPFIIISAIMIAASNVLLSTLSPGTSTGKWIGYQIFLGLGRGLGLQMPIIAVQNILPPAQIPVAMASIMFSRNFTAALLLSFSDTLFTNSLKTLIPKYTPSINPQSVINAGATGFRTNINERDLANVLVAYAKSLDRVFGLAAGAAVGCFVFAWGMGWYDIRRENKISKALSRA